MADTKISALTAATAAAAANEFAINEAGTSKKLTAAQLKTFCNPTLVTGATGTVSADAAPSETWQVLTSDNADIPTTSLVSQLRGDTLAAGYWWVEYYISWESNVTTTGITFNIDFTGTATQIMATRFDMIAGSTALATVGISDQEGTLNSGAGTLPSMYGTRIDATNLGPNAGVDTINVIQMTKITCMLQAGTSGNLDLRAASEIASTITRINAGTYAIYRRLS